jgi:hypothetical protein
MVRLEIGGFRGCEDSVKEEGEEDDDDDDGK